jgi:uncharacterized membrane protein
MLRRRRNVSWIQRWSRPIIGAITIVGLILTSYLTITKLMGGEIACTTEAIGTGGGCNSVLDSPWAYPLGRSGPPLSFFGSLAYLAMGTFALGPLFINPDSNKELRKKLESWTWWFLLIGGVAMASFSGYLMYVLAFELKSVCVYCISSAFFSLTLLTLSILGHDWEDMGQIFFTGVIVFLVTIVGALGVYANVNVNTNGIANSNSTVDVNTNGGTNPNSTVAVKPGELIPIDLPQGQPQPPTGWDITTTSGEAEIALAKHLTSIGAINYGAFWCPHCYEQKQLLGKEAFAEINYVECDPQGKNPQPQLCVAANIKGFPSWSINGQLYAGTQQLQKLAEVSGYTGPTNFKYKMPY